MKNEILDVPIIDTFEDFLDKDEKILWTGFTAEQKDSFYHRNADGSYSIDYANLIFYIFGSNIEIMLLGIGGLLFGLYNIVAILTSWAFYVVLLFILVSFLGFYSYAKKRRTNKYVITSKRILFQLAHLPINDIQQILFSELKNCIVTLDGDDFGILHLAAKNPKNLPDKLFELGRHSPTLERIDNTEEAANLIRNGIKNVNKLL